MRENGLFERLPIIGVDPVGPVRHCSQLGGLEPHQLADPRRIIHLARGDIPFIDALIDRPHRQRIALFTVAQRGLAARQLFRALTQFVEQPRVLHRDHCLRREILQQRDLFFRIEPYLPSNGDDIAEQIGILA